MSKERKAATPSRRSRLTRSQRQKSGVKLNADKPGIVRYLGTPHEMRRATIPKFMSSCVELTKPNFECRFKFDHDPTALL